jgi:hypothetical protein
MAMSGRIALTLALAFPLVGCIKAADTKAADAVTAQFYQEVAAKQYQAIYDGASPDLKNATSSDAFVAMMQRIDANMGACQPPKKQMNLHINENSQGIVRRQAYSRTCANGTLNETVTIAIRNGTAAFAGYHVVTPGESNDSSDSSD